MKKRALSKYANYRDSEVPWLGQIPAHWQTRRLKDLVQIKTGGKDTVDNIEDGAYPFFVRSQTVERINSYSFDGEAVLTAGDGVGVGKVFHYATGKFDYHQRVYRISHFKGITGKFIFYYMKENFYKDALRLNAKATVDSLRLPMFQNFIVAFGSREEQHAIANYLDTQTAHIDRRIDLLTQKAAKYAELKQALINETVLRGLDKTAPLKDSGVDWIGQIPAHWKIARNKEIFTERNELSTTGEETLLTVSHITGVTPRSEKNVNMFMAESMEGYKVCHPGDLIINTMWAWMGALGTSNYSGICSPAYNVYKPNKNVPYDHRYFDHLYRIPRSVAEMTRNSKGIVSSRLRLYPRDFFQIQTILPDAATQKAIADYLDDRTAQINRIVETINAKTELLKELRKTLINDVVTGKIKVYDA
jgi:type I restriction enzyme, S subunit